jgi:hypothetical protein
MEQGPEPLDRDRHRVTVAPLQRGDGGLGGFLVAGRWPDTTREWAQVLLLAVRLAAVPGMVPTTAVFHALDGAPDTDHPGAVGMIALTGPVIGSGAPGPGELAAPLPAAVLLLHPPAESRPTLPEAAGSASGCVLLPGLPHLGLEHRAAWVEAEADGSMSQLVSRVGIDPASHPDTAVLAMLLAA